MGRKPSHEDQGDFVAEEMERSMRKNGKEIGEEEGAFRTSPQVLRKPWTSCHMSSLRLCMKMFQQVFHRFRFVGRTVSSPTLV